MGNCQAIDAATLVIQHPSGKTERFYSPVSATHVMKMNPGHYVALLISTTLCTTTTTTTTTKDNIENYPNNNKSGNNNINTNNNNNNPVRLTRIKLLKPTDTLHLGHVYRLITTQEVMKGLRERKQAKMKQNMSESSHKQDCVKVKLGLEMDKAARRPEPEDKQGIKPERNSPKTAASTNYNGASATAKTRFWQPSLQSISEVAS